MHFKFKICALLLYLKLTKIAHQGISSLSNRVQFRESESNPKDDFDRNQSKIKTDQHVENVFPVFAIT